MHQHILSKKNLAEQMIIIASMLQNIANQYVLEPQGLSMSSFEIMYAINEHGSITPTMILNCRGGTKSNISQRLNFLEKNNYIKRVYANNKKDKREVLVKLTAIGQKKLKEVSELIAEKSILLENLLSKDDIKRHSAFLNKVFDILIKHEEYLKKS